MEEPPPVPPAAPPADNSPTADSWEAEADDALLTPEDINEGEDEDVEQQVHNFNNYLCVFNLQIM